MRSDVALGMSARGCARKPTGKTGGLSEPPLPTVVVVAEHEHRRRRRRQVNRRHNARPGTSGVRRRPVRHRRALRAAWTAADSHGARLLGRRAAHCRQRVGTHRCAAQQCTRSSTGTQHRAPRLRAQHTASAHIGANAHTRKVSERRNVKMQSEARQARFLAKQNEKTNNHSYKNKK